MGAIVDISEVLLELGLTDAVTDVERAIAQMAITKAEGAIKRHLKYDPVQATRTEYYPQTDRDVLNRAALWEVGGTEVFQRRVQAAATSELQMQHLPIRSITTLSIDLDGRSDSRTDSFPVSSNKIEGTDFWMNSDGRDGDGKAICRDGVIRSFGLWPTNPGTVKVVYVAGYTSSEFHGQVPLVDASPIMDAVIDESVRRAKRVFINSKKMGAGFVAGPIISEGLGDYSYSVDSSLAKRLFGSSQDIQPETQEKLEDFVNMGWILAS